MQFQLNRELHLFLLVFKKHLAIVLFIKELQKFLKKSIVRLMYLIVAAYLPPTHS